MAQNFQSKHFDFCLETSGLPRTFWCFLNRLFLLHRQNNKFEIKLGVEQQFPRNLFQRNKAFIVSDNKTFILPINNTNSATKHRTMQYRYVDYMASSSATVIGRKDIQIVTVDIKGKWNKCQKKRKSKYVKSKVSIILKNF